MTLLETSSIPANGSFKYCATPPAFSHVRVGRIGLQDDLADVRTGSHQPVSFRSQCEREVCVDDWPCFSALDQRPDFLMQRPDN